MSKRPPSQPTRRFGIGIAGVLLGVIGAFGPLAGTALAENSVVSSDPADGSTVAQSPETIAITFSEAIGDVNTITVTCTDLYTVGPRRVSDDRLTMTADLIDELPKGACVASWVVSNDEGSPNGQGNITFTVANDPVTIETTATSVAATTNTAVADTSATQTASRSSEIASLSDVDSGRGPLWLGRLISVFGLAVLLGSLVLIAVAWPEGVEYLVTIRFVRAIWILALVGTWLYVAAAVAAVTGAGIGSGLSPTSWIDLIHAGVPGIAALARIVLVAACGWVAVRPDRVIDPVTQMSALAAPALAVATIGLSRTNMDLPIVGVPVSIIHALAMSVWLGGVVLLARVVLAGPGEEDLVHAVRGFSKLSNLAIGVTILTGLVQMVLLDGGNLFGSSHGAVVLLKTVGVAVMIFVAVSARQFVNQRLSRANAMTVPMADRLRRAFGIEAAVGVIVLATSAWLLSLTPPSVNAAPPINEAITMVVEAPEARLAVSVTLSRDRVGRSGMAVEVSEPDEGLSSLEIVLTAPPNDEIGTITQPVPLPGVGLAVLPEGDNGVPLLVAGDWTMVVNAITPTGAFSSPPQRFTILNADGTEAVTELTVPPVITVTIPTTSAP